MRDITAIIWDMDGVKYPLDEAFQDQWRQRGIACVQKYIPHLSAADARAVAKQSFETHHSAFDVLILHHGADFAEACDFFHNDVDCSMLAPASTAYVAAMRACNVDHAILTHSNRRWATRLLTHLDILHLFDDARIVTIDDIYPHKKATHREPFERVLDRLNCTSERAIMVEDSPINLRVPKEMGMTTVLVGPKAAQPPDAHVDHVFTTPEAFLAAFVAARTDAAAATMRA